MILLAIDTSTRYAGAAVLAGDKSAEISWRSEQNHGVELMPAVIGLLDRLKLTTRDITHIGVALGPGGFSAVRVGIAAATGLALPGNLPLIGVSTFDIESAPYAGSASKSSPVYALIPAGRDEVAWASYEGPGTCVATGLSSRDALFAHVEPAARFCGEGVPSLAGLTKPDQALTTALPSRSPVTLAHLAMTRLRAGAEAHAPLQPIYARQPSITMPRPQV